MRAVVFAYSDIGCAGLETLLANGVEVSAVFTHADAAGENIWFRSVAETAAKAGIPAYSPDDVNHPLWVDRIAAMEPDCLFSFYYRKLLGSRLLALPRLGAFNMHGSLLPKYRGRCPVNWVLINGEKETGLTLHFMTERADAGDIVAQSVILVDGEDTARSLHEKMVAAVPGVLVPVLPAIAAGRAPRRAQSPECATYYGGRRPEDGRIDWSRPAADVCNLVRAVTKPFPGAFSNCGGRIFVIWNAAEEASATPAGPGTVLSVEPLRIACGEGVVRVEMAQEKAGIAVSGSQLARDANLAVGMRFGEPEGSPERAIRVLILGANGFIGSALTERLLREGRFVVRGLDRVGDQIDRFSACSRFQFIDGDLTIHRDMVRYEISKADVVIPLAAIATPMEYVRNPLRVFELVFEENIRIIRYCSEYGKRLIFPSTSEVYGMADADSFDEDSTPLVVGPVRNQRWIYSSCKQLLDRVILATGRQGLRFSIFRPFNWIGPRLDRLESARTGNSRVITQMIACLVEGRPITLVDGGEQKRCFTALADGIEGLLRIVENRNGVCDGEILNLGNPDGELSIRELGEMAAAAFSRHPFQDRFPPFAGFCRVEGSAYYGPGYQDVARRRPSIAKAERLLGWRPKTDIGQAIEQTLDFFLREHLDKQ